VTTAKTRLSGVIGWPVEHSRSPAIHTAALEALGIDAVYLAFPVEPDDLGAAIEGLRTLSVLGLNVTLPHKEHVMSFVDRVEPGARAIGAVNTIVREGDELVGTNTDAEGLVRSLREENVALDGANVLVLGAGGAARASVYGIVHAGARVEIAARRVRRAEQLARDLGASAAVDLTDAAALRSAVERADVVVQATSATMGDEAEAFAAQFPVDAMRAGAAVVDLVYAPRETVILKRAAERGLRTVGGIGMLIWQAALAFERWHGVAAPIDAMRRAADR
jgi:shikimate dehydrogenase